MMRSIRVHRERGRQKKETRERKSASTATNQVGSKSLTPEKEKEQRERKKEKAQNDDREKKSCSLYDPPKGGSAGSCLRNIEGKKTQHKTRDMALHPEVLWCAR